jgi:phosphate transport system substrate-binding protein
MRRGFLAGTLLLCLLLLDTSPRAEAQEGRQKIIIAGAQSLAPLAEKFSDRFRKEHPGIEIEIRAGGSNYAIGAARRGEIDIGLVARNLDAEEKTGLRIEPIGHDAIVLLSYPGNPLDSLTLAQIQSIYLGKTTYWNELGGEAKRIIPLTREKSAAIHSAFLQDLFGKKFDGQEKAFTIRASKEKVLRTVKRITGAIGYGIVRLDEARSQGVKVLAIEGKLPTEGNIVEALYPFTRPQYIVIPSNPSGIAQQWISEFAKFAGQGAVN